LNIFLHLTVHGKNKLGTELVERNTLGEGLPPLVTKRGKEHLISERLLLQGGRMHVKKRERGQKKKKNIKSRGVRTFPFFFDQSTNITTR